MGADIAFLQPVGAVLKTKMESHRPEMFAILFAVMDDPLLRKAEREQVRQDLRAPMSEKKYAASDARVAEWLFTLVFGTDIFLPFLNGRTFGRAL